MSLKTFQSMNAVLQEVAAECGGHDRVRVLPFDLAEAEWDSIAAQALSSFPEGLDYIVHNAGVSQRSLASETSAEVVYDMFQLNSVGPIALTQALLPGLLRQGKGHFVAMSSMAGAVPAPGQAIYSGNKFAVHGYFHALRAELADTPIGVTICCPGPFRFKEPVSPRRIVGSQGVFEEPKRRPMGLEAKYLAQLIAFAAERRLSECWMTKQPFLAMAYIMQYCPVLGIALLNRIGPRRAAAAVKGDGYSIAAMLGKPKDT